MYKLVALAYLLLALSNVVFSQTSCSGSVGTSTGGRKIGIVIDSSGSMAETDPDNLRIVAGKAIASSLITKAAAGPNGHPDLVTVIDFDDSVRVVYPLGDPASVSFAGIDSSGGTYIAIGVQAAIDQITSITGDVVAHVGGIVVFTDGQDSYVCIAYQSLRNGPKKIAYIRNRSMSLLHSSTVPKA
jgi:Mg-chelatase subunit ChlD